MGALETLIELARHVIAEQPLSSRKEIILFVARVVIPQGHDAAHMLGPAVRTGARSIELGNGRLELGDLFSVSSPHAGGSLFVPQGRIYHERLGAFVREQVAPRIGPGFASLRRDIDRCGAAQQPKPAPVLFCQRREDAGQGATCRCGNAESRMYRANVVY